MLEQLITTWKQIKSLRQDANPGIRIRARTILRNLMRLRETPDDKPLQAQTKRNLADLHDELRRVSH